MFILSSERDADISSEPWQRYQEYLRTNKDRFPRSAYELATSDWYWNPEVSGCPHDAWLERLVIMEPSSGERHENRMVEMTIELLAPYHDGLIQLRYPQVFEYRLDSIALDMGHRDWRYDEFRVNDAGRLVHEIEWCGWQDIGRWMIIASDVEYKWTPLKNNSPHTNRPNR